MNRFFFLCFLFVIPFSTFAQEKINWLTWEEAVKKQQVERKKIFIDLYTSWCGWCKKMDATTFKDQSIVSAMNKYYYAVKFDAERKDTLLFNNHKFYNINPTLKRGTHTFAISLLDSKMTYPSFVILDENFNRSSILTGYQEVENLLGSLLFFGTNRHILYQQYLDGERKKVNRTKP